MQLIQIRVLPGLRKGARVAKRRAKDIAAGAVVGTLATGLMLAPSGASADESVPPAKRQYPACQQEDDGNCVWPNQGPGFSFVSGPVVGSGPATVVRVSDRLADRLIARHGTWQRPEDWVGHTIDGVHSGSFTVTARTVISEGPTTYAIKTSRDGTVVRIGTS